MEYCAAILAVVLGHHPQAKELFKDIGDGILLSGVQETFYKIEQRIPEGRKIIKGILTKAGYRKSSKPEENYAKSARRL